jgi:hypothetical protein
VAPERVHLQGSDSTVQLVVTGVHANGGVRDLTSSAVFELSGAECARIDRAGLFLPVRDGEATLSVRAGGLEARVPILVTSVTADRPMNFANDVVPVFSKHSCNSGGCHGKSGGQNGFQLSLFGFIPDLDYRELTQAARGRRVFPAAPEHSLLLRKATGTLPHGGGARFTSASPEYRLLHRWMRLGMPRGRPEDPQVETISVYPQHRVLERGSIQQLRVTASYSDHSEEDVTLLAQFSANEPEYVEVNESGRVRALDLVGQGAVLVRFKGRVALFRATVPSGLSGPSGGPAGPSAQQAARDSWPQPQSFIDEHVFARLERLGVPPSGLSSDAEFLRRVSADVCGTLPAAAEAERFLADSSPQKRRRLVDDLLERPEYASFFALKWADLLRNRRDQNNAAPFTIRFHRWLRESLAANKPYDRLVRELLCAEGNIASNPPVAWYRALDNPKLLVDDTAQVFLGTRMQCARCHHHPYEKWEQADYWHFANYFSRVNPRENRDSREFTVSVRRGSSRLTDDEKTSASYRRTYEVVSPPGGPAVEQSDDVDPRHALVDWMVSPSNPLFARALVNRYWKHFFGRGIVEPEDDLRETNPPSNPELLDALARDFAAHGYDLKRLVRAIAGSAAYQLSSEPRPENQGDRQSFARFHPRRLSAEVLADAVDQVTGLRTKFSGMRRDTRAIELPDEAGRNYFLEVFGKPDRATACECERSSDVTLPQMVHLLNSREVQAKLQAPEARPAAFAADSRSDAEKLRELFLWCFARPPRPEEIEKALEHLDKRTEDARRQETRRRAWEDLFWALLNTKEFLFLR